RPRRLRAGGVSSDAGGSITACACLPLETGGVPVALTQTQLATAVAERAGLSRTDAKRAIAALEQVVLEEVGNGERVRIGGVVQLSVRLKPAQKARKGRNPATGEEITIAAKPASVDLRARPLTKAKAALPSMQKARRRLAAWDPDAARRRWRAPSLARRPIPNGLIGRCPAWPTTGTRTALPLRDRRAVAADR